MRGFDGIYIEGGSMCEEKLTERFLFKNQKKKTNLSYNIEKRNSNCTYVSLDNWFLTA